MFRTAAIASACGVFAIESSAIPMFEDDGLGLLQVAATKHSQMEGAPWDGRRHGTCSMGGDTHVKSWYADKPRSADLDPMQYGLYNFANSKDARFMAQLYQCPVPYQQYGWINAMAYEIDGTRVVILPPKFGEIATNQPFYIRADGIEYTTQDLPFTIPGTNIELRAHRPPIGLLIVTEGFEAKIIMPTYSGVGRIDQSWAYIDNTVRLAVDNVPDLDENSFCVKGQEATPIVDSADPDWSASLFSDSDHKRICEFCESYNEYPGHKSDFRFSCARPPPPPPPAPPAKTNCETNGCSWIHAQQLCHSLQGDDTLYNDCLFDFCITCDDQAAVEFVANEEDEHPGPVCVAGAPECAPDEVCTRSVKMNTLTVTQNNLGGVGPDSGAEEIRYGNAAVVNGKAVDLVVTTDGTFQTSKPAKNGKAGAFGVLNVKCGTSVTISMKVVDSESGAPVTLEAVSLTWYDLDEGKKQKGRATVTTCGSTGAIVSENTELTVVREGDCSSATSSVAGTGKDNPKSPHTLDASQLARSLTLPFKQVSEWTSTLSLAKGWKGRNFLFAIEPSVACGSLPAPE